jgi:hypothetical protein
MSGYMNLRTIELTPSSVSNGWVSPIFSTELPYPIEYIELPCPGLGKYTLDLVALVRLTGGLSINSLPKWVRVLLPVILLLPLIR